jgi:hypothetical protein
MAVKRVVHLVEHSNMADRALCSQSSRVTMAVQSVEHTNMAVRALEKP